MSDSLRDQLLGLGFKPPIPERKKPPREHQPGGKSAGATPPGGKRSGGRPHDAKRPRAAEQPRSADRRTPPRGGARGDGRSGGRSREEIDLAKAYAIRAQKEKEERIEAERVRQEEARQRREARARLATLLQGRGLNAEEADIARHFEYGGKIKRIYVTGAQLASLNAGELGVVQHNGRYLLVDAATLAEAEAVFAPAVALKVDPSASAEDDPYADPRYQVPDDLVW